MIITVLRVPASAQDSPGTAAFKRLDKNGDGKLTRDEAPSPDRFAAADADKDGAVTPEEFRRYLAARQRPQSANPTPAPSTESSMPTPAPVDGKPVLKTLPYSDAVRDAAGRGQLFECVHLPGLTDVRAGMNGFTVADFNGDGFKDVLVCEDPTLRATGRGGDRLRLLLGHGGFVFIEHPIRITGSTTTAAATKRSLQVPNLVDLNGDGFLDIFVTCSSAYNEGKRNPRAPADVGQGNLLLLSQGAFDSFADFTTRLGTANDRAYNRQSSFGDVNRDGWLDIAIGCDNIGSGQGGEPHSRLYVFQPNGPKFEDGRFEDIGGTDRVPDFGGFYNDSKKDRAGPGINLRDLDNDGDLDLIQNCHVDVREPGLPLWPGEYRQGVFCWKNLLVETGETRFEKVTGNGLHAEAALRFDWERKLYEPATDARAPGLPYVALADVDHDGDQDIFATGPSDVSWSPRVEYVGGRFWRNEGGFRFTESTAAMGLGEIDHTYRQWFALFDEAEQRWQKNWKPSARSPLAQTGIKPQHPLEKRPYYADAIFADFDNDGWQDLVVLDRRESAGMFPRSMLWMNRGDGTFEVKPTTFSGLDSSGISAEATDLNNDGLLDLFIAADPDNTGSSSDDRRYESKVYWNTGEHGGKENHWLQLTFTALKDAELIGARIELTANGKKQYRWIHSNHSYKSGGQLDAHFGLGQATSAAVKVVLLDGRSKTFAVAEVDRTLTLEITTR